MHWRVISDIQRSEQVLNALLTFLTFLILLMYGAKRVMNRADLPVL